jgi:hypothetical protein
MGATWSAAETMPETVERTDFARQQEIQCLKDHYEIQIRMLQDTYKKERALKQGNQKLKMTFESRRISTQNWDTIMKHWWTMTWTCKQNCNK